MTHSNTTVSQPSSLRSALFGAGRHAQHHVRAILRCAGAELVAVADPSEIAQTAMRSIVPGIKSYGTPEDWLGAWRKFRRVSNSRFFVASHGLGMKNTE